jgi:hypothetical protein
MVPKQYLTGFASKYKYLSGFTPTVIVSLPSGGLSTDNTYIVDYGVGECVYTRYTSRSTDTYIKVGKRIKQDVLQLIKCDMWKVITIIDGEIKLNESDYKDLNMEIRNHSLECVTDFINRRGLHQ